MTTRKHGSEVKVGDDLWFLGEPHRITRIVPYVHPVCTGGETWAIAYSDGPVTGGAKAWGITLELTNPAHHYEVS